MIEYSVAFISALTVVYLVVRVIIKTTEFCFSEKREKTSPTPKAVIYLVTIFSLALLVLLREITLMYKKQTNDGSLLLIIYALLIIYVGYCLHILLFTDTASKLFKKEEVKPKFKLKKTENCLEIFTTICKDFSSAPKLFTYKTSDLLDLVDPKSDKNLVFDIKEENEELFFLFIDTIWKHAILNAKNTEVATSRFTIGGAKINNFSNKKNKKLTSFIVKLKEKKRLEPLKYQLLHHKYKSPFLDNI